jgi:hypothetical protein
VPFRIERAQRAAVAALAFFAVAGAVSSALRLSGRSHVYGLVPLFDLDAELSAPTWFSSMVLLACVAVLVVLAVQARATGGARWGNWALLAVIFTVMSVDETASYHESWMDITRDAFGAGAIFFWAWVIPGTVLTALVALVNIPFLRSLPRRTAVRFLVAGAVFVSGALGMEMVNGWYFQNNGGWNAAYATMVGIEELLEMTGALLFLRALLLELASRSRTVTIVLDAGRPTTAAESTVDLREPAPVR